MPRMSHPHRVSRSLPRMSHPHLSPPDPFTATVTLVGRSPAPLCRHVLLELPTKGSSLFLQSHSLPISPFPSPVHSSPGSGSLRPASLYHSGLVPVPHSERSAERDLSLGLSMWQSGGKQEGFSSEACQGGFSGWPH